MIGLTTHPGGGKGYQMYLDGALAADMASDGSYLSAPHPTSPPACAARSMMMRKLTHDLLWGGLSCAGRQA